MHERRPALSAQPGREFAAVLVRVHGGGQAQLLEIVDDPGGVAPLMFELDRTAKLTSIKVVPLTAFLTNKYTRPVWHLVSESNSAPTRGFLYGMAVPGMCPAVAGTTAEPLALGTTYRLLLQAGTVRAEHDFDLHSTFR
jgi:hypothetical protein